MSASMRVRHNNNNKFCVATVHYSLDSEKTTQEWKDKAREGMTERAWNREYELDYTSFAGKPVWNNFDLYNLGVEKFRQGQIIYRGWDFGYHRPCSFLTWLNQHDQWYWYKAILGQDEGIYDFGMRVKRYCESTFPSAKYIDAGDPAGNQMNDKSEQTSVQILASIGISVKTRKQPVKQGIEIIRKKFDLRADGKPGLLINPDSEYLIDMVKGGLHYPEATKEGTEKENYEKDGYFDHCGDSARYLATEMFDVTGFSFTENEILKTDTPERNFSMDSDPSANFIEDGAGGLSDFF